MARVRLCKACGDWHAPDAWPVECIAPQVSARGGFPVPMFISDTMAPLEHVDGRFYDSKSQFRAVTKANGCIEVGTEKMKPSAPAPTGPSIRDSLAKAQARINLTS